MWELLALRVPTDTERTLISRFEAAVDALAARRREEAEAGFLAVLEMWPDDPPTRRYLSEARSLA